jgi:phosphatidylglycerophosphate synthase
LKINLPNALTLLRIFLVPFLLVVLLTKFEGRETVGLIIFLFATATDFFDGWLARRRGEITTLGTLLDPIADKLLISAAFVSLVELGLAPAWMVVVILGRGHVPDLLSCCTIYSTGTPPLNAADSNLLFACVLTVQPPTPSVFVKQSYILPSNSSTPTKKYKSLQPVFNLYLR